MPLHITYRALRRLQLAVTAGLILYMLWRFGHGRHAGDEALAALILLALLAFWAERQRRREAGIAREKAKSDD